MRPVSPKMKVGSMKSGRYSEDPILFFTIGHQSSHLENTNLFTPVESQKQCIMALRIKTNIPDRGSKAPGDPSLLWHPRSLLLPERPSHRPSHSPSARQALLPWVESSLLSARTSETPSPGKGIPTSPFLSILHPMLSV